VTRPRHSGGSSASRTSACAGSAITRRKLSLSKDASWNILASQAKETIQNWAAHTSRGAGAGAADFIRMN
jgi:hypothetical protein